VLDLCSGSGGKALAIAALMENKGLIAAHDNNRFRLLRSDERIRRSGASIIRSFPDFDAVARQAPYDTVLVDAPCSSTGTIRRNPDVAWRWKENEIQAFGRIQLDLLLKGAYLVKRGGKLVYSTCSLLKPENQYIASRFLEMKKDFSPCETGLKIPVASGEGNFVRLPLDLQGYEGDGYFIAVFSRNKS
jgi:16S rRNA (cytosine967-C5)-methyltransferase